MRRAFIFLLAITALAVAGCAGGGKEQEAVAPSATGYGAPDLLVDTAWLSSRLSDPLVRILDVRPQELYREGHVPGAAHLDPAAFLPRLGPSGAVLPSAPEVEEALARLGVGSDTRVVLYDVGNGLAAAAVFWLLEYYGHPKVSLLNAGYAAWAADGRPTATEAPSYARGDFKARPDPEKLATKDQVLASLRSNSVAIIDARSPAEYAGQQISASYGGHIPGASNVEWKRGLEDGRLQTFKAPVPLKDLYEPAVGGSGEIIVYCQSGIRASHAYFALRLQGYSSVKNYLGSWAEWSNDRAVPIEGKTEKAGGSRPASQSQPSTQPASPTAPPASTGTLSENPVIVPIVVSEHRFSLASIHVRAGSYVRFVIENRDTFPHEIGIATGQATYSACCFLPRPVPSVSTVILDWFPVESPDRYILFCNIHGEEIEITADDTLGPLAASKK